MTTIVKVPFHGHELTAIETADAVMVPLKPVCAALGLHEEPQRKKINARATLYGAAILAAPSAGGPQKMFAIPKSRLAMWLASINPAKVRPELRETLELYQREAADVLDRYFRKGEAIPARAAAPLPPPDPAPPLPRLRAPRNPMAPGGWIGLETADYVEYLQLRAWAFEVENRRLRRRLGETEARHV